MVHVALQRDVILLGPRTGPLRKTEDSYGPEQVHTGHGGVIAGGKVAGTCRVESIMPGAGPGVMHQL